MKSTSCLSRKRVFNIANSYWTTENSNLHASILSVVIYGKVNSKNKHENCVDFNDRILKNKDLLENIRKSEKFK